MSFQDMAVKYLVSSFIYMLYAALTLENWASHNTLSWQLSCFCDLGQSVYFTIMIFWTFWMKRFLAFISTNENAIFTSKQN